MKTRDSSGECVVDCSFSRMQRRLGRDAARQHAPRISAVGSRPVGRRRTLFVCLADARQLASSTCRTQRYPQDLDAG